MKVELHYGFLTELDATKISEASDTGRANWRLLTELAFQSRLRGLIVVPAGFVTDFASVPRLPLTYALFGDTAQKSAVVHDYLCRIEYAGCRISWSRAADVFLEAMKFEGVPLWRRRMMYWGVKYFGDPKRNCDEVKP